MNERDLQDMRDAYPPDSPKHPDWAEAMADRADMDRKRAKESLPEPGEAKRPQAAASPVASGDRDGLRREPVKGLPGSESDLLRLKEQGFEVYGWVPMEADE